MTRSKDDSVDANEGVVREEIPAMAATTARVAMAQLKDSTKWADTFIYG